MFSLIYTKLDPLANKRIQVLTNEEDPDVVGIYEFDKSYIPTNTELVNKYVYLSTDNNIFGILINNTLYIQQENGEYDINILLLVNLNLSSSDIDNLLTLDNPILEIIKHYCQQTNQDINGIIEGNAGNNCTFQLID